jgi:uncharacterized membrane protein (UPF0127 family)
MKTAERIVIVAILLAIIGGGAWIYFAVELKHQAVVDAVERGDYEIRPHEDARKLQTGDESDWQQYYTDLTPLTIGSTTVQASVADSLPERIKGLSGTPYIPAGVVKLFVFNAGGEQSMWMKDMNYNIDMLWLNEKGKIVHIEEHLSPDTYPKSFSSPVPAWYVIEAKDGFVASSSIKIGEVVTGLPKDLLFNK